MISLGIWSCRWRELKPINFGGGGSNGDGGGGGGGAVNDGRGEGGKTEATTGRRLLGEEERGRESGLGGEYEMVGVINKGGGAS